jgi:excisionase family DNA binding protein
MTNTTQSNIQLLRLTDVSERLNLSMSTVRKLVKKGQIRTVRIGRILLVRPIDLESYIQGSINISRRPSDHLTGEGDQA